ncbi:Hypothetical_protein [Hexamita inflata]|uniref:Hypothetical_protein n=1 Tax=Hexamita inflata TaxID=28002 RepID=A0AA86QVV4_9EUKA|nr:Hypothetical protein HINF_LOCUS52738 [Hexamita inflata]
MQEQLQKMRISQQIQREKKELTLQRRLYGIQKHCADNYNSQILSPDQIQELAQKQNQEIQQKDQIISQCKQELINLLSVFSKSQREEYYQICKLEDQSLLTGLEYHKFSHSQYTQTTMVSQQIITHHNYNEDQKKEALVRLIRDGNVSYKQQLKMNDKLPSIRTLLKFRKQIENSKLGSQNEQLNSSTSNHHENQISYKMKLGKILDKQGTRIDIYLVKIQTQQFKCQVNHSIYKCKNI